MAFMQKLSDSFTARVFAGALAVATPAAMTATPAFAQSAQTQQVVYTSTQPISVGRAIVASTNGRIVLHYGEGITLADNAAQILQEDGLPAAAYPGGKVGEVALFINGKPRGHFTNSDIARGRVTEWARDAYREDRASLNSTSPALASLQR